MAADSYLLALPMEMLQRVSSHVDRALLPTFRLTCRTIETAASKTFAEQYLEDLYCFVHDPSRIARVKAITSQPHLARVVRTLTLTMDPYEESEIDMVHCASRPTDNKDDHVDVQHQAYMEHRFEQLRTYGTRQPDFDSLLVILRNLDPSRCELGVYTDRIGMDFGIDIYDQLAYDVLNTVSKANYPITYLRLNDSGNLNLDKIIHNEDLATGLVKDLRQFCLYTLHHGSLEGLTSIAHILLHAKGLRRFHLEDCAFINGIEPDDGINTILGVFLKIGELGFLTELCLSGLQLPGFQPLFEALQQCHGTLQDLYMGSVRIVAVANEWSEVIAYIRTFPQLQYLRMYFLRLRHTENDPEVMDVHVYTEKDCMETVAVDVDEAGGESINAALAQILGHGIVLQEAPEQGN